MFDYGVGKLMGKKGKEEKQNWQIKFLGGGCFSLKFQIMWSSKHQSERLRTG